ncbi:MAG: hypothetical protein QXF35_00380 [Candidatus Bilamarchaeaceae archaeon]
MAGGPELKGHEETELPPKEIIPKKITGVQYKIEVGDKVYIVELEKGEHFKKGRKSADIYAQELMTAISKAKNIYREEGDKKIELTEDEKSNLRSTILKLYNENKVAEVIVEKIKQ